MHGLKEACFKSSVPLIRPAYTCESLRLVAFWIIWRLGGLRKRWKIVTTVIMQKFPDTILHVHFDLLSHESAPLRCLFFPAIIGHFTVVCLLTWPVNVREAGGDLALMQTSLLFSFKCQLVSIRTTWFTQQKQWGLSQNKVTSSLVVIQRPGH